MRLFTASARPARSLLLLSLVAALGWGCASYTEETREIRSLYRSEAYPAALAKLDASDLKDESKNRLLYRLEKAMILDRMGQRDKSRALLIEADKIADDLYTVSATRTAASFVVNEGATDYSGEDYEKVAIHTEMALSFIADGKLEAARVEARKINNKLQEINQQYDDDHKNRYAEDAFARYLAGIIYEARGEVDDALIDYGKAVDLYSGPYKAFVDGGVPDGLVEAYYRLLAERGRKERLAKLADQFPGKMAAAKADLAAAASTGEVVVIQEVGHIATKTAQEFVFPFGKQIIRFSYPVIQKSSPAAFGATGVTDVGTGRFYRADNVQDMDAIARAGLEDRRGRLIAKQAARLIAKGQLTEQAYRNLGPLGGIAANVYSAVTETADTRSWTLLPEAYFVTRIRLKPGMHTLRIQSAGRVNQIEKVDVKKGAMVLLRDAG